jgi:hypothetical protein
MKGNQVIWHKETSLWYPVGLYFERNRRRYPVHIEKGENDVEEADSGTVVVRIRVERRGRSGAGAGRPSISAAHGESTRHHGTVAGVKPRDATSRTSGVLRLV